MAEKNCSRCNTRHAYPWGKSCQFSPYSRYREEIDKFIEEHKDIKTFAGTSREESDLSRWLSEAVQQNKIESHNHIDEVEQRLHAIMDQKFARLENLMSQWVNTERKYREEAIEYPPPAPRNTMGRGLTAGPRINQESQVTNTEVTLGATGVTPGATGVTSNQQNLVSGTPRKAGVTGVTPSQHTQTVDAVSQPRDIPSTSTQLSEALRQLSLAFEPSTTDKSEGMILRPEWHSQHNLKDIPIKNMDHQRMSITELLYGMICVLENLISKGNSDWNSYLQHVKFIARQSISNSYIDSAFTGYDRMVVNKYLENRAAGFQAGDLISVASNFHAANFKQGTVKDLTKNPSRRKQRVQRRLDQEEPIEIPESWPDDICFFYNRKRCFGRCNRSHICRQCRNTHRDIECKNAEKKN